MTVPVLTLNFFPHPFSRQRYGMVRCLAPVCTFTEPHDTQAILCGHLRLTSQSSAALSVGNIFSNSNSEIPLRSLRPGAFFFILSVIALHLIEGSDSLFSIYFNNFIFSSWLRDRRAGTVPITNAAVRLNLGPLCWTAAEVKFGVRGFDSPWLSGLAVDHLPSFTVRSQGSPLACCLVSVLPYVPSERRPWTLPRDVLILLVYRFAMFPSFL